VFENMGLASRHRLFEIVVIIATREVHNSKKGVETGLEVERALTHLSGRGRRVAGRRGLIKHEGLSYEKKGTKHKNRMAADKT